MNNQLINFDEFNFFIFPSNYVWWNKVENHNDIKQIYLPRIKKDYQQNKNSIDKKRSHLSGVSSSYFYSADIDYSIFDEYFFQNIIWKYFTKMITEMNDRIPEFPLLLPTNSEISNLWYNTYSKDDWLEIHCHSSNESISSVFSGIYILELNEPNGTKFVETNKSLRCFSESHTHLFDTKNIEEGYIMIFPSELHHYVKPTLNNRTIISFNIISHYANL